MNTKIFQFKFPAEKKASKIRRNFGFHLLLAIDIGIMAIFAFLSAFYLNGNESFCGYTIQRNFRESTIQRKFQRLFPDTTIQRRLRQFLPWEAEMNALKKIIHKFERQRNECSAILNKQTQKLHQIQCNETNQVSTEFSTRVLQEIFEF